MLGVSIAVVCQGEDNMFLRPEHANQYDTDSSSIIRLWDNVGGRIACPLTTIWIFSLSTGKGFTAYILRSSVLSKTIGTNSYGCFLFHQMVAQWYYAATRNGHFWSWWRYRKVCVSFDFYRWLWSLGLRSSPLGFFLLPPIESHFIGSPLSLAQLNGMNTLPLWQL